jgi:hypothetical protein
MKRAFAVVVVSTLLISALTGLQPDNSASAQYNALAEPPVLTIVSPENKTYDPKNFVSLSFTLESSDPESWQITFVHGVKIYLDGDLYEHAIATEPSNPTDYGYSYSFALTGLELGSHSLYVVASYRSIVWTSENIGVWRDSDSATSKVIYFSVGTSPLRIGILSIDQQQIFNVSVVPLDFTVSKPVSWMGYSLNGQDNVTIAGNTTLTGLSEGTHSLVVYANDSFGQTGKSLVRYFTVATTNSYSSSTITLVSATVVISAVAVCAGLLLYLKKRKR